MRNAAIPAASDDFTARLLARTQELAAAHAAPQASNTAAASNGTGNHGTGNYGTASSALKALGLAAGGAVAAAGVATAAAYFLAGDPRPVAAGASAPAFQQEAAFGLQPLPGTVSLDAGSQSAGSLGAAGMLTSADLEELRTQGWSCPELHGMGFHVLWARREAVAGQGVLELRLTDGTHFATVLEQHAAASPAGGSSASVPVSSPTNILTGHPASDDGFVPAPSDGGAAAPGSLWINASAPWRAIYQAPGVTFTYISDLPSAAADDGISELVRAGSTTPAGSVEGAADPGAAGNAAPAAEGLPARLQRGLGRIMELLTP
ncbi:hypothetical protein [Arthrobacter sp. ISL-72]|uniref:hypothetical protein n=1 Tax=Arthrobacter sp. ISL-72 TaxID=2819114 RepID=UPI001BE9F92B|nr:hypothetical protein [Arthrobacter sp. ISL-72]MBT2594305.1 hypothetical protein [Arthrobacter sp. ISL-72]